MSVNIIIRTDASNMIGTGHVMRCLTLAEQLMKANAQTKITVISRDLPGNLSELIKSKGFDVKLLEFSKEDKHLTLDAISFLTEYSWPGNVREMQNLLSRIVLLEPETTISKDIVNNYFNEVISFKEENTSVPNFSFLANYTEKELLNLHANEVFKMCDFNKSETAKKLDINYRTLIKRLNIE